MYRFVRRSETPSLRFTKGTSVDRSHSRLPCRLSPYPKGHASGYINKRAHRKVGPFSLREWKVYLPGGGILQR